MLSTLPAPGTWHIDPARAAVAFSGRVHRLAPTVQARFSGVRGAVHVDPDPASSQVEVAVEVGSITTGNRIYDEMLEVVDPFQTADFPEATYRSHSVCWTAGKARVEGELTLRGVSRAVSLTVTHAVQAGATAFRATGTIDRTAFGLRCDIPAMRFVLPRQLRLDIDVVALPRDVAVIPRPRASV